MTGADLSDEALFAFLRSHPDVRNRVASIALTVENSEGDLKEAELRKSGWSRRRGVWDAKRCWAGRRGRRR